MGNAKIFYGTCSTGASTSVKQVTCTDFTSSDLVKGAMVFVTFDNTNSATASGLKLDVNSTGEKGLKAIFRNNAPDNLQQVGMLQANVTYLFVYSGTYWVLVTCDYSIATPSVIGESEAQTGTATTGRLVSADSLKRDIEYRMTQNQPDWNQTTSTAIDYIKNKPTINDSTITIQMNGSTVDTFTTNAASAKTINLGGNFVKYEECADEAAYTAIATKDSGTLYLIPESSS